MKGVVDKKVVVFLQARSVVLSVVEGNEKLKLDWPERVVSYQEVVNRSGFVEIWGKFLDEIGYKQGKAVVILGKDIVYEGKQEMTGFVPFDPDKVALIKQGDGFLAVNRDLYEPVLEGLRLRKGVVEGVWTESYLGVDPDQTKLIWKMTMKHPKANFLWNEKEKIYKSRRKLVKYVVAQCLAFFVLGAAIVYRMNQKTEVFALTEEVEKAISIEITTTPAPDPSNFQRQELVIRILNGSGIAGEAARAKEALESMGYVVAETGNAVKSEGLTNVRINPDKIDFLETLLADLNSVYERVASEAGELETGEEVDVEIIIR